MNPTRNYRQNAVLWAHTGIDRYGLDIFAEPKEIKVRWQAGNVLFIDREAREKRSRAVVFCNPVDAVQVGDRMMLGELDSNLTSTPAEYAWPVESLDDSTSLDASSRVIKAYL